jgi:hypothetical protein
MQTVLEQRCEAAAHLLRALHSQSIPICHERLPKDWRLADQDSTVQRELFSLDKRHIISQLPQGLMLQLKGCRFSLFEQDKVGRMCLHIAQCSLVL